jgi:protein-disulfide isomerase
MKNETKIISGIILLTITAIVGLFIISGNSPSNSTDPIDVEDGQLVRKESHKTGNPKATVTIVEFADFQCPACAAAHPELKKLISEYQDEILFVHRHFPLPGHQHAELTAKASEAAAAQDKFWEMHNKLFENQDTWSTKSNPKETLISYAKDLGLDTGKFESDLDNQELIDRIRLDKGDGLALGVDSTPTIYINGQKYEGERSYQSLKQLIDDLLKIS